MCPVDANRTCSKLVLVTRSGKCKIKKVCIKQANEHTRYRTDDKKYCHCNPVSLFKHISREISKLPNPLKSTILVEVQLGEVGSYRYIRVSLIMFNFHRRNVMREKANRRCSLTLISVIREYFFNEVYITLIGGATLFLIHQLGFHQWQHCKS